MKKYKVMSILNELPEEFSKAELIAKLNFSEPETDPLIYDHHKRKDWKEYNFNIRAFNAIGRLVGISRHTTLNELAQTVTKDRLLSIDGVGERTVWNIEQVFRKNGVNFK